MHALDPVRSAFSRLPLIATLLLLAACGGGGDASRPPDPPSAPAPTFTSANLAILVAEGDATSEAIAAAYQRARGIPDSQVFRVPVPRSGGATLSAGEFEALKTTLDARLPATIQATLVTWAQPSRVVGSCAMSLTSALAFGYDAGYCGSTCRATTATAYYDNDTRQPWTDLRMRPSMMLGAATLTEAEAIIARGVAADGRWRASATHPASGQAVLIRTDDVARSVRYLDFQSLVPSPVARLSVNYINNFLGTASNFVTNQNNLMFYFTGLVSVPQIETNTWLPGAAADHLTSLGGMTEPGAPNFGQMPITAWLRAGATASYGTVEEPCNYLEKFSRASLMIRRYARGETLMEAYWKSVRSPGQGLFVGEPLARPWGP
jgi:uncharacterized protein (TIGR03790 family)